MWRELSRAGLVPSWSRLDCDDIKVNSLRARRGKNYAIYTRRSVVIFGFHNMSTPELIPAELETSERRLKWAEHGD